LAKLLLSLHVLAAVVAIDPVTVAASMIPEALRRAQSDPDDREALTTLRMLHRICGVYAGIGIAVPVFGFATASILGVLGSGWLIASILLTAAAAVTLTLLILPAQDSALAAAQAPAPAPAPTLPRALPWSPASSTCCGQRSLVTAVRRPQRSIPRYGPRCWRGWSRTYGVIRCRRCTGRRAVTAILVRDNRPVLTIVQLPLTGDRYSARFASVLSEPAC
jgi:hypothetical protein